MRWRKPNYNDTKIVTKFLLFPLCLYVGQGLFVGRLQEYRWLEKATILYRYGYWCDATCTFCCWKPDSFIEEQDARS